MPDITFMVYGLASAAVVLLSIIVNRRDSYNTDVDAVGLSIMLLIMWGLVNLIAVVESPPESMKAWPVLDLISLVVATAAWMTRRAVWKVALAFTFLSMMFVHAWFWIMADFSGPQLYNYALANNIAFAVELICISAPGVGSVASRASHLLSGLGLRRHSSGARRR